MIFTNNRIWGNQRRVYTTTTTTITTTNKPRESDGYKKSLAINNEFSFTRTWTNQIRKPKRARNYQRVVSVTKTITRYAFKDEKK